MRVNLSLAVYLNSFQLKKTQNMETWLVLLGVKVHPGLYSISNYHLTQNRSSVSHFESLCIDCAKANRTDSVQVKSSPILVWSASGIDKLYLLSDFVCSPRNLLIFTSMNTFDHVAYHKHDVSFFLSEYFKFVFFAAKVGDLFWHFSDWR